MIKKKKGCFQLRSHSSSSKRINELVSGRETTVTYVTAIEFSHLIFHEGKHRIQQGIRSVTLRIPYSRGNHVPVPHMNRTCRRRCTHTHTRTRAHTCKVHTMEVCNAPLHVRRFRVYAWKRPRANSQCRDVPLWSPPMVVSCTSRVIGFIWNSSKLNGRGVLSF